MAYPTSHLYFHGIQASVSTMKIQVRSEIFYVYHDRALHNYFMPSHREHSAQHNQSDMRAAHDWKVGFNIIVNIPRFSCILISCSFYGML